MRTFYAILFGALTFMALGCSAQEGHKNAIPIVSLMQERHSGRNYDDSKSIASDQIAALSEAARSAPSCYNDQPWFFIICDRSTQPEAHQKVLNSLVEFNQGWAKNAPLLVVVLANSKFDKNQKPNRWGSYDTGAAAMNMMLQATHMGLMPHQMGGFDETRIQNDFKIPSEIIPMAIMAIGYEKLDEKVLPKERKPIAENFFFGAWKNSSE